MIRFFLLLLFFCATYAYGQSTTNRLVQQLDSVTVTTSSKMPLKATTLMRNVHIIDEATLAASAGQELSQLLSVQPGMIVNGAYSNSGAIKSLFLEGASSNATLVLLDGIPMTDVSGSGAAFDWRFLSTNDVSRIEILKGSQSVLYGSNAVAGVVNIISKKSLENGFHFAGGYSYGTYDTYKANASLSGRFKKITYRASYNRQATSGISEATMPEGLPPSPSYNKDGFQRDEFSLDITYHPSAAFSITPFLKLYSIPMSEYDAGAFADGNNAYSSTLFSAGLRSTLHLKKVAVNLLYGTNRLERTFDAAFFKQRLEGLSHSVDAYVMSKGVSFVRWLAGVHFQSFNLLDTVLLPSKPDAYTLNPYVNFILGGKKKWDAEIGLRMVYHSQYGLDFIYNVAAGYALSKSAYVYANYTRSFLAPTLSQLYGQFGPNVSLRPEVSQNMNIGLRVRLLDNKVLLEGSWFSRTSQHKIVYALTDPVKLYINQNSEEVGGTELKATYQPNDKLKLSVWYTHIDGHLNEKNTAGRDTSYFHLIRRPRNSAGASIKLKLHTRWSISFDATYYAKRSDNFYDPNTFSSRSVWLDEYALANMHIAYEAISSHLTIYGQWNNMTNASFFETYGYNTLGSTMTVGVRFNY